MMKVSSKEFHTFEPDKHIDEFITIEGKLEKLGKDAWVTIQTEDFFKLDNKIQRQGVHGVALSTENLNLKGIKNGCVIEVQGYLRSVRDTRLNKKLNTCSILLFPEEIKVLDKTVVTRFLGPEYVKNDFLKQFYEDLYSASCDLSIYFNLDNGFAYAPPRIENDATICGTLHFSYLYSSSTSKEFAENEIEQIISSLKSKYTITKINERYMFKKIKRGLYVYFNIFECPLRTDK